MIGIFKHVARIGDKSLRFVLALTSLVIKIALASVMLIIGLALTAGWAIPGMLTLVNLVKGQFNAAWHMFISGVIVFLIYVLFLRFWDDNVDVDLEKALSNFKSKCGFSR